MCLGMSPTDRKLKTMRLWRAHETPMKLVWIQPSLSLSIILASRFSMAELEFDVETKPYVLKSTCQDLPRPAKICQGWIAKDCDTTTVVSLVLSLVLSVCSVSIVSAVHERFEVLSYACLVCGPEVDTLPTLESISEHFWIIECSTHQLDSIRLNKWNQMNQIGFTKDPLLSSLFWDPLDSGTMWCNHFSSGDRSNSKRATAAVSSTKCCLGTPFKF